MRRNLLFCGVRRGAIHARTSSSIAMQLSIKLSLQKRRSLREPMRCASRGRLSLIETSSSPRLDAGSTSAKMVRFGEPWRRVVMV